MTGASRVLGLRVESSHSQVLTSRVGSIFESSQIYINKESGFYDYVQSDRVHKKILYSIYIIYCRKFTTIIKLCSKIISLVKLICPKKRHKKYLKRIESNESSQNNSLRVESSQWLDSTRLGFYDADSDSPPSLTVTVTVSRSCRTKRKD